MRAAIAAAVRAPVEVAVRERPPAGRSTTLFDELLATPATPAVEAAHAAVSGRYHREVPVHLGLDPLRRRA